MIINRKLESVYIIQDPVFKFLPGNNIIPSAIEEKVFNNKYNQELIKAGHHEVIAKGNTKEPEKSNDTKIKEILSMSPKKAVVALSNCMDYQFLKELLVEDRRPKIQEIITKQIKKLEFTEEEMEKNKKLNQSNIK